LLARLLNAAVLRRGLVLFLLGTSAACSIKERDDFLIGRTCFPEDATTCDDGQRCLPHAYVEDELDDFRCRGPASFELINGREPPLAYCDEARGFECPGELVCNADRLRESAGDEPAERNRVCQKPDNPFAPPLSL
jgi:hypothetical protein